MLFSKGVIIIQEEKKYYNQNEIVKEINLKTGCSLTDIYKITNALGDVVKDKFSDKDDYVELKLFPGLKVTSRYIPSEQSVSKRLNINSNYSIFMSAVFTDDFRKKVRELHNNLEWNQLFLAENQNRNKQNKYFTMIAMNSV